MLVCNGLGSFISQVRSNESIEYITITERAANRQRSQIFRIDLTEEEVRDLLEEAGLSVLISEELAEWGERIKAVKQLLKQKLLELNQRGAGHLALAAYYEKGNKRPYFQTIRFDELNVDPQACVDDDPDDESAEEPDEVPYRSQDTFPPQMQPIAYQADPLEPDMSATEFSAVTRSYRALGEQYTHFGKISLGTADRITVLLERQLERQQQALEASEERCRELQRQLMEQNQRQAEQGAQSQQNVVELARLSVTQQTVSQLGNAVQGYLITKAAPSVPPGLQTVIGYILSDPPMLNALSSPDIQAMFADPQVRAQLTAQMQQLATMKKQMSALQASTGAGAPV